MPYCQLSAPNTDINLITDLCCAQWRLFFPSFPSAPAVRMSLSFNHPAPIPIKSTLPHMEALLSAPSVSWSPCCPPWTCFSAACQSLQSPAAPVRPLPQATWVCSSSSPRVEASAAAWACENWMLFDLRDASRDLRMHLLTAAAIQFWIHCWEKQQAIDEDDGHLTTTCIFSRELLFRKCLKYMTGKFNWFI